MPDGDLKHEPAPAEDERDPLTAPAMTEDEWFAQQMDDSDVSQEGDGFRSLLDSETGAHEAAEAMDEPEAAAAPEGAETPAEEPTEAQPAPEAERTPDPEPEVNAEDYEKGLTALRFEGAPDSVVEALSKEQIAKWGADLRTRQLTRDTRLADSDRRIRELEARIAATERGEPSSAEPTPTPDPIAALDQVAAALPPEAGNALKAAMQSLQAQQAQIAEQLQQSQAEAAQAQLQSIRGDLRERFPEVSDDGRFALVVEKATTLAQMAQMGQYTSTSPQQLMMDAARIAGLKEQRQDAAPPKKTEEAQRLEEAKANGTPTPETQTRDRGVNPIPQGMSAEDVALAWLEDHEGDVAGARARARQVSRR